LSGQEDVELVKTFVDAIHEFSSSSATRDEQQKE
jgi:hypothetical protein